MAPSVKRSVSTPNVQQAAVMAEHHGRTLSYPTDKRRNKLGYHRTSVACGHCRRRKIRCLTTKDGAAGRCSNCVRLKKECNFFPVETPPDRRPSPTPKPDVLGNDVGSATSSPSPGSGQDQMLEKTNGYPASVPVTPTHNLAMLGFSDSCRQGTSGHPPRIPISQSACVSRRPSLAQIHPASIALNIKPIEQAFRALREGIPRAPWEVPSRQEPATIFQEPQGSFEDPSKMYWQLNSPALSGGQYSFTESLDSYDGMYSQVPSRMGSIDYGLSSVFGYPTTHSPEGDFGLAPDMRSANASTASLTASTSETSHYGPPSGDMGYGQHYMTQWVDQTSDGTGFDSESTAKEGLDPQYLFSAEEGAYSVSESFHLAYPSQPSGTTTKQEQE